MANVIDIVVGKQAQAEVDKLIASLRTTHDEIIKINQQGLKINSGASPKNPQQMNASVKETIALTAQLTAEEQKLLIATNRLESLKQKQIQTQIKENALTKSTIDLKNKEVLQRDRNEKALAKEEQKLATASNMYNKVQAELNKLNFAYQNLAVRQAQGATLTKAEAQQMDYLRGRIQMHDKTLKAVDGTMGKYSRNVGNYAGSFNPLSNSINQLSREMPAFANSVQTGFMAISNNLSIFFDAMGNIIEQNKVLQKAGEPTKSVLSQLATSLFSFQTLLSVGVTLLTVYGKEIVSWVSSLWGASDALNELNKNQKAFNASRIDGAKESIKDKTELEKYVRTMRNSNLTANERAIALKKIRDQFPFYFKGLKDEVLLNGDITKNLQTLNLALERRAVLNKAQEANIINKEGLVDLREELRLNELNIAYNKKQLEERKKVKISDDFETAKEQRRLTTEASNKYNDSLSKRLSLQSQINQFDKAIATNKKIENDLAGKTIGLEEELGKTRIARKKKEKELDEQLLFGTEAWLNAQISIMEETRSKTAQSSAAYKEIGGSIKFYQKWLETLTGAQKKSNEEVAKTLKYGTIEYYENLQSELRKTQQAQVDNNQEFAKIESQIKFYQELIDAIKGTSDATKELSKEQNDYFESFIDTFSSNSGFSKMLDILRGNIKDFGKDAKTTALAISEAFQEAFNTISASSQANFDAEYNRLEMQKNVSLQFAGESATAKEEIERQYSDKKREIARREAEAQKKLAIFNIAIDTAQAVVAALPNIPLSIVMGVLGAAQIAMVSAQQIPQFWKGTDNAPEGLAWTQEKVAEVITDKKGNVKTYGSNKGAELTYLNKGDKVYKSQQDYINKTLVGAGIQPMKENNSLTTNDFNNGISKLAKTMQNNKGSNTQVFLNNKQINTDYFKGQKV